MASGRLGTSTSLTGGSNATVYTVPTGYYAVVNVNVTNTSAVGVTARVAVTPNAASVGASEWIEYGVAIAPGGTLERTGIVADAGKAIVVWASTSTAGSVGSCVNANVFGIETSTT
jgi:hypothetical protein